MPSIRRITDELEKPDLDDRSYRVIELPNQLEALLVHDPQTDKSSASLSVDVGNFSDETDMPGMAHAVEHLLFMGTQKYPKENEYSSYLSSHSGHSNAYTSSTHTNYFFECAASHETEPQTSNGQANGSQEQETSQKVMNGSAQNGPLYGALDRFAQFFVSPLFLENTLDRELRAVDSENKKNLQSDAWRLNQLSKTLSNSNHPFHHFSTGNLKTLRDDPEKRGVKIRDAFIQFYEKHYSANRMKLVVLGRESLDELEGWVSELFSEVKDKNLSQNRWDNEQPLTQEQLQTEIFAKPVMEMRSLEISFPYQDEDDMYETQPARYLGHLIGHEGPGSILAYLKEKGLANTLSAGQRPVCPGSAFFEIDINLTPEGLKNYKEVVRAVFSYIGMMKETPPVEWMHDEMKSMGEMDFKFQQKIPPSRFTMATSAQMQKPLPRKWLLSGNTKFRRFDAKAIVHAMQFLREDNFRLMIVSQEYPGDWDQSEKWYGTQYKVEKIPTDVQSDIRKALAAGADCRPAELKLPNKNEFIPSNLDVEKTDVTEPAKTPKLLRDDQSLRLWWKKDDTFWVPKANVYITLRNSLTNASPANHVKTSLFMALIKDDLTSYAYDAEIAGLGYGLDVGSHGISLSLYGYNDKLHVLLQKILTTLRNLDITSERFDIEKERLTRKFKNWDFQQPYYQIGDYTRWLLNENGWVAHEYAAELEYVTIADLKAFGAQLLAQTHIEMLVHGNLYREDAKRIAKLVENTLKSRSLPPSQWQLRRNMIVPTGKNFVYEHTLGDPANINHAIEYYLHVGPSMDLPLRARLQLFAQMTDEPSFDQLRTKEQLGYVVWSGMKPTATMIGYRVLIQSERPPSYLEQRIDLFLHRFGKTLKEMSTAEFEGHKRSLIIKRLEKLKNLDLETSRLWSRINGEYYNFFQVDEDVAEMRKLQKSDIEEFFSQYIDPLSKTRAKLSIHMIAQATSNEIEAVTTNGEVEVQQAARQAEEEGEQIDEEAVLKNVGKPVLIEDVLRWKAGLQVSSAATPVVDIHEYEDLESKL